MSSVLLPPNSSREDSHKRAVVRGLPQEGCGEKTPTRGLWWGFSCRVLKLSAHSHHVQWNLETRIGWLGTRIGWLGLRLDNMGHSHFAVNNLKWERTSSVKPWLGGRLALNTRSYAEAWTTGRCMLVTWEWPPGLRVFLHFSHFRHALCQSLPREVLRSAVRHPDGSSKCVCVCVGVCVCTSVFVRETSHTVATCE